MKRFHRILVAFVFVVLAFAPTAAADWTVSSKRVGFPPPKHPTTTTTSTTTRPASTTTTVTRPTTTSTTSTTSTTLPVTTTTRDTPNQPTNVRYYTENEQVQLRWEYQPKTYPITVGIMTCFYGNGVSLCGDGIDYGRDGVDYFAILTAKPELFGPWFPRCMTLSVKFWTDDGVLSNTVAAPPTCIEHRP